MFEGKNWGTKDVNSENDTPLAWERKLIAQAVHASTIESRRSRRWKIFFQMVTLLYLSIIVALLLPEHLKNLLISANPHTSLIEIKGPIFADSKASADNIIQGLRDAFDDTLTKGIILRINSPGGSPVQAGYVYDEIRRLRAKHADIPVYAVIVDMGASAAYYIAAAADKIYADQASIVGSIGVLMNGFGFVNTLENLGIERRLLTAGEHKGILDPFSPLNEYDKQFTQELLTRLHTQFINAVKEGRKGKLADNPDIFSGLFWSGAEAKTLGLIDDLGSSSYVAREVIKAEDIIEYTHKDNLLKRFAEEMGTQVLQTLLGTISTPTLR